MKITRSETWEFDLERFENHLKLNFKGKQLKKYLAITSLIYDGDYRGYYDAVAALGEDQDGCPEAEYFVSLTDHSQFCKLVKRELCYKESGVIAKSKDNY